MAYSCTIAATNGGGTGTAAAAVQVAPAFNDGILPVLMMLLLE